MRQMYKNSFLTTSLPVEKLKVKALLNQNKQKLGEKI